MLSLKSPAKINLFLRIFCRRPDGYHELASLFQAIDLCDRIDFEITDTDQFTCSDSTLPTDDTNLVLKALKLYRRKTGIITPVAIHLEKIIPHQAGLGGGSSNAATTLWALNTLFGKSASEKELMRWGAELGSDVSFFLSQGTAYCTGRGEILKELPPLKNRPLFIIKPSQGLSTPQVYGKLKVENLPEIDPEIALASFFEGAPAYFNDLEQPAFEVMPELAVLQKKLLDKGFSQVLMSGSGSAFFCLGGGDLSDFSNYSIFKTNFINRSAGHWY